ncbi:MAG: hypothetical protein ACYS7Y_26900 [Planctomycetota bacterium]|jgi:hypothetical protein
MRTIEELTELARRDDWHQHLVGSDLRQILGELARLREKERDRLVETVQGWKERLGRLDMMSAEVAGTPGAEPILPLAEAAAKAINDLGARIADVGSRAGARWAEQGKECHKRVPFVYSVPIRPGDDMVEQLGVVKERSDGRFDWWRRESKWHRWDGDAQGVADTREEGMNHVLEGWGWDPT